MEMINENDPVDIFLSARKSVMERFGCEEDFFVKPMLGKKWLVRTVDDFRFLTFWVEKDEKSDAVIVSKNGRPMIFEIENYTMIIAIDCIKMAFVFQNDFKYT